MPVRLAIAFVGSAILAYWTLERLLGERTDPNISATSSSDTGSATFLVSGTKAVLLVATIVALALGSSTGVVAILAVVVLAHWIIEKEEREA